MKMNEHHKACEQRKQPKLYKIGMFANMNRVTIKTLRYYDEQNLIKPVYVDEKNGYRYYEASQIADLHRILALRGMGFSIEDIRRIINGEVEEAYEFFADNKKISKKLKAMMEVGLPYLSLGQPLSTLSGGERQRVKLAKDLHKKGNIYILDEPTTGLHASDIKSIMTLLESLVKRGNTVIVIEHNLDVMKQADYIIDIGPDGGSGGGKVVFTGTPKEMIDCADTITARYLRKSIG